MSILTGRVVAKELNLLYAVILYIHSAASRCLTVRGHMLHMSSRTGREVISSVFKPLHAVLCNFYVIYYHDYSLNR